MATLEALAKPGNRARSCEGEGRQPIRRRAGSLQPSDVTSSVLLRRASTYYRGERLVCGRWVGEPVLLVDSDLTDDDLAIQRVSAHSHLGGIGVGDPGDVWPRPIGVGLSTAVMFHVKHSHPRPKPGQGRCFACS
jgi:hypothetical protein